MALYRHALGYAIRTERIRQGLTLRDIAQKAHMALGYLSEVERGQKDISSELLECVAHALGVSLGDLTIGVAEVILDWEQQEREKTELLAVAN